MKSESFKDLPEKLKKTFTRFLPKLKRNKPFQQQGMGPNHFNKQQ